MLISIGLWLVATRLGDLPDTLDLRVVDATIDLGYLYPFFIYLVVAGTTSAVNLTDGLDGLAAGCAAIVLLAYIAITFTTDQLGLSLVAGCLVGACVGFLWFNSFPASIFMGDTGSLGLGGAIAALAVMTQTEVLLIILGGIFVIEALSVMIQVFAFQTFRKRVFLMAPIHHHFELQAWSETKIILRFWIVAAVCAAIGFTLYQQSDQRVGAAAPHGALGAERHAVRAVLGHDARAQHEPQHLRVHARRRDPHVHRLTGPEPRPLLVLALQRLRVEHVHRALAAALDRERLERAALARAPQRHGRVDRQLAHDEPGDRVPRAFDAPVVGDGRVHHPRLARGRGRHGRRDDVDVHLRLVGGQPGGGGLIAHAVGAGKARERVVEDPGAGRSIAPSAPAIGLPEIV